MKPVEWFIQTRGNECEYCHRSFSINNPAERHHAIVRRSKRHPEYDASVNIELVCHDCHQSGEVDSYEHRQEFAMRQINRGLDVVSWYQSLDLKAPEAWLLNL